MSGVFVGFNPAPDCIRDDIDPLAAIVFGAVWRFSQMDRRQCDATLDTIAERSGLGTTATRARLRKLTARRWILAEERPGLPTVYRDAGRWVLRVVGEDSTPTLNVGPKRPPQREALPPPTRGVALPQREALAEESLSKTEQRKTIPVGETTAHGDRARDWSCVETAIADTFGGLITRQSNGRLLSWVGKLVGIAGRNAGNDPLAAAALWSRYVASSEWQFRPRKVHELPTAFGAWVANGASAGGYSRNGRRKEADLSSVIL